MFQRKPVSPLKAIAIVGAVALLLLPTYILVKQDLVIAKAAQEPLAVVAISWCGQVDAVVVDGAGKLHPLHQASDEVLEALGKSVAKGSAQMVEVPCPDATPSQQTYLHQ